MLVNRSLKTLGYFRKDLGVALLREDREALRDREAGVHHRGELPCVNRQVLVLDLTADLLDADGLGCPLLDGGRDDAPRAQLGDGGGAVVRLDLTGDDRSPRAAAICVHCHSALLLPSSER